jgi:hypothetical protein
MSEMTKADLDAAVAEIEKRLGRPPTREQIRAALACPVCKEPGGLSLRMDKCEKCGSYLDKESGQWIVPAKPDEKGVDDGWFSGL